MHQYASVVIRGRIEIISDHDEKQKGLEVLIEHLEEQPAIMKAKLRLPERQQRMDVMHIWKLTIDGITGKKGS